MTAFILLAVGGPILAFGLWMSRNAKSGPQDTTANGLIFVGSIILLTMLLMVLR